MHASTPPRGQGRPGTSLSARAIVAPHLSACHDDHASRLRPPTPPRARRPSIYVEQSPLTVPVPLRGQIKRPDYIVGIPASAWWLST